MGPNGVIPGMPSQGAGDGSGRTGQYL
jgi:hypothetical protein